MTLKHLNTQKDILETLPLLNKIPLIDISTETMLARALLGEYGIMVNLDNDMLSGVLVYKNNFPEFFIVGVYAKNQVKEMFPLVIEELREQNYTSIKAVTRLTQKAYEKVTGFKKLWSVYGRKI